MDIVERKDAITNIIDSVAKEQSALSKILSAESKKIEKVLEICTSEEGIIKVNKSVKSMVNAITRLEGLLVGKLELFEDYLCYECEVEEVAL